jgi:uncharacterized protein (DUF433 family)
MNDRIVIDPKIHHGKPGIKGTRVSVVAIIGGMAGGMSIEEVCREYEVSEEDVRAALDYAAELIVICTSHYSMCRTMTDELLACLIIS